MRSGHVVIALILVVTAIIAYITIVPRKISPKSEAHPPIIHFARIKSLNTSSPVDDEETEMGTYSAHVKTRIRDIKRHLVYRPPLSILPFVRGKVYYTASPKYRLAHCVVEKIMCTLMNGILCYLFDTEGFVANNRSIQTETWQDTFCLEKNDFLSWKTLKVAIPEPFETTFIVREPVNRFVSVFIDKCVHEENECYGCYQNVTCVIEKLFESFVVLSTNHPRINDRSADVLSQLTYEERHFLPLTWYCDLWDRFEEYHFIKYGEDSASFSKTRLALINLFEKQGVEQEKIENIKKSLKYISSHATKQNYSDLRRKTWNILLSSQRHLQLLSHLYYYDFIAFGYNSQVDIYYPYS